MYDSKRIKPEFRANWAHRLKSDANFFKHAKIDGEMEATIEFNPDINPMLAFFSCAALAKIGEKEGLEEMALTRWLLIHEPQLFLKEAFAGIRVNALSELKWVSKKEFFEGCELLHRHGSEGIRALMSNSAIGRGRIPG